MKPLILLTAGLAKGPNGNLQHCLYKDYSDAISWAGGVPVLALSGSSDSEFLSELSDGLLITGGSDLDPILYNESMHEDCGPVDAWRDQLELDLFREFLRLNKPVFGICRGLQIINVELGGSLWQDIPNQLGMPHPYGGKHTVMVKTDSHLENLFGKAFTVNSFHHQALHDLGEGLEPIAYSENGEIVEAVIHKSLPIFAVQWHPERMAGSSRMSPEGPDMLCLFRYFIEQCK